MNDITRVVGINIKRVREDNKMTQKELAVKAGVHRNYISNIENGKINPTMAVLRNISIALKVDVINLIEFE